MHKILSTTLALALCSVSLDAVSDQDKVQMCHKGKDFFFVEPSVQAHLKHGDSLGSCEDGDSGPDNPGYGDMDGFTDVIMIRCEAARVVSFDTSFDYASIPEVDDSCPDALSGALKADFKLRSITSGSASDDDGDLRLYTDYLLLGEEPQEG